MAPDDEDSEDLYDDEFDFVDDDDENEEDDVDDESDLDDDSGGESDDEPAPREAVAQRESYDDSPDEAAPDRDEEKVDEFGRPEPVANYVVHIYEFRDFKRTIDRPFTPEDAEAFASEFNRTSKSYGRFAIAGKVDAKPRKSLD